MKTRVDWFIEKDGRTKEFIEINMSDLVDLISNRKASLINMLLRDTEVIYFWQCEC